jgi:Domain of unknown function (DUF397)
MTSNTEWRKSSFSGGNANDCVEVAYTETVVGVRDSKNKTGGALTFSARQWQRFITHTS